MNKFLHKQKIQPLKIQKGLTISQLVDLYNASGSFQGGRLGEAARLYRKMIQEDTVICMTISGAMIPAGMGGIISELIRNGFVDMIISTGANLYHDMHFALDLPVHQGDFNVDDRELFHAGIERIYDIFITEDLLKDTDLFIQDALGDFNTARPVSTSQIHYHLGQKIKSNTPFPERSLLATAADCEVPVYTSSFGDSSIGMNVAFLQTKNIDIVVDPNLDVWETSAIVFNSQKNGVVIIGGGSPKNFYLQTQPFISQIASFDHKGHDFDIQISVDAPHWGGLSGATPSEAISWGKINPNEIKNSVVVYSDATIALPILAGYALAEEDAQETKKLLTNVSESVKLFQELIK
ncbi:MAG: deoxyhypusine synthase [candidate division KSB1 bacterium]|jgi:deoxyhypusine synthase|nr:deoxyhypusine synthase [candidate division KSB1 bacterium]